MALTAGVAVTPVAAAAENSITVTNRPMPGTEAHLRGWCADTKSGVTVSSPAFVAPVPMNLGRPRGVVSGQGQVKAETAPGSYELVMACGARQVRGKITVWGHTVGRPALVLTPGSGKPGDKIKVLGVCDPGNGPIGRLDTVALAGKLTWKRTGSSTYEITAPVARVKPEGHPVQFYCGSSLVFRRLIVLDPDKPAPPPGPGPVVKPKGGVETGGGMS
ncbi:hypothetical protein [Crossiella sp. NPDC003009]